MAKRDYEVGYGKPPKRTRFKKGQSGNPKGRPTGVRNFRTDLEDVLSQRITLREGGREKRVTTQYGLVKVATEKGLRGDVSATEKVFRWTNQFLPDDEQTPQADELSAEDKALLDNFLGRTTPRRERIRRRTRRRPKPDSKPRS